MSNSSSITEFKNKKTIYTSFVLGLATELQCSFLGIYVIDQQNIRFGIVHNGHQQYTIENVNWNDYGQQNLLHIYDKIKICGEWKSHKGWHWSFVDNLLFICYTNKKSTVEKLQKTCETLAVFIPNLIDITNFQQKNNQVNNKRSFLQYPYDDIIGQSNSLLETLEYVDQVIEYTDEKDLIYIFGEIGTGKSILAQNIHRYSRRNNKPFIEINCGAIVETLCETEFFGIAPNSGISGAPIQGRPGLFELAHGGFLFLDEVSELLPSMQAALLRVVEGAPYRRVCGRKNIYVDVRIISASSRDIKKLAPRSFMPELAERLETVRIELPSLAQRKTDIPFLIEHFCTQLSPPRLQAITPEVKQRMIAYHWPGNIRQLANCIRQCSLGRMPQYLRQQKEAKHDPSLDLAVEKYTRHLILKRIAAFSSKKSRFSMDDVAQSFSLSREAFRRRLKAIGYTWKQIKEESQKCAESAHFL